jgi:hypothetical protein
MIDLKRKGRISMDNLQQPSLPYLSSDESESKSEYAEIPWALQKCPKVSQVSIRHILNELQEQRPCFYPPLPCPLPALSLRQSNLFHRQAFLWPFLMPDKSSLI